MMSYFLPILAALVAYLLYRATVNWFLKVCDAYDDLDHSFLRGDYE